MKKIKAYVLVNYLDHAIEGTLAFENGWMPFYAQETFDISLPGVLWNETQNRFKAIQNMGYEVDVQPGIIPMHGHEISNALHELNKDESLRIDMENAFKIELRKIKESEL